MSDYVQDEASQVLGIPLPRPSVPFQSLHVGVRGETTATRVAARLLRDEQSYGEIEFGVDEEWAPDDPEIRDVTGCLVRLLDAEGEEVDRYELRWIKGLETIQGGWDAESGDWYFHVRCRYNPTRSSS